MAKHAHVETVVVEAAVHQVAGVQKRHGLDDFLSRTESLQVVMELARTVAHLAPCWVGD